MKKNKIFSFKYFLYDFIRITAALPGLIWFRPKRVYVSENAKKKIKGGALIISNHIGMVDPMYLLMAIWQRRQRFIVAKELLEKKFNEFLFKKGFLCIPIDRENFSLSTFKEIVSNLKNGTVVTMFPEGHVNTEKEGINNFKSGATLMAYKSDAPIIPVYIKRREHFYNRLVVAFGEPIFVKDIITSQKEIDKATAYLYEKEKELEKLV